METQPNLRPCSDGKGTLPSCANLAVPYVAPQQSAPKRYNQIDALANGTLYPGLNLPFHLKIEPSTLTESTELDLQALCFVVTELGLYLDTHPEDAEAFTLFQQFSKLVEECGHRFETDSGPLTQQSSAKGKQYEWLRSPWPWEFRKEDGR